MTILQYLNAFRVYSADALILALGVTLVTSFLKKTVLKKCPKKVYVFLPFVLGFVFYAAYRTLLTMSAEPFTSGLTQTFEGGFACGCAATLYYVVYEQFFRTRTGSSDETASDSLQKETANPLIPLLNGVVCEESRDRIAQTLLEESKGKEGNELMRFVLETLRGCAAQNGAPLTESELFLYAKMISAFLASLPL